MMKNNVIELNADGFIGKGRHKKCFMHPLDKTLCIKMPYNEGGKVDLDREIAYIKHIANNGKNHSMLPKYYGEVETNLGKGHLYEFIVNYDGSKCKTLEDYLKDESLLKENFDMLCAGLKKLKKDMYDNEIITMGLFSENIIVQYGGQKPLSIGLEWSMIWEVHIYFD